MEDQLISVPWNLVTIDAASNTGVKATHGSHQGAQKSTITNGLLTIVSLKFSLLSATTAMRFPIVNLFSGGILSDGHQIQKRALKTNR